ncbi:MAG: response regulator transcription factor [Nocardioidaceae bacterium]
MDGTRVFLVDDFAVTREGVRAVLECEPDLTVVGQWDVAEGAAEAILAAKPDVAVLDVRLPDGSGIEVLREVHERDPEIKGLMLTSHDDGTAMFAAAMAGASGYVLKWISLDALVNAVRLVASGHSLIDPGLVIKMAERHDRHAAEIPGLADLTPSERRVLSLVAQGMTNRQIGDELSLAEKTVKNHVTSILGKLGVTRRTQAALIAARLGEDD